MSVLQGRRPPPMPGQGASHGALFSFVVTTGRAGDGRVCRAVVNMSAPGAVATHCGGARVETGFRPGDFLAKSNPYIARRVYQITCP